MSVGVYRHARQAIAPEHLGRIDTFRFEERVLLAHARSLIAREQYGTAHTLIADRERGFWVHRSLDRQLQWAACQDLPGIDRAFQIKVMHKNDRFKPQPGFSRATTVGQARKAEIKKIMKMIKDFNNV